MLQAVALLLVCQLCGEIAVRLLGWPLPGPVVGMMLLLAWLVRRGRSFHELDGTVDAFLKYLALLFVPAGVGVMTYLGALSKEWATLGATLILSAAITLVVTGWIMQKMLERSRKG